MPEPGLTLGELAEEVRSKNAGPVDSGVLSPETIGRLYHVDPAGVKYFQLPAILALKISFPRPGPTGTSRIATCTPGSSTCPWRA